MTVLRRGSALLGGLALAVLGTLAGAPAAQAHDVLQGTDPADGSTVAVAPDHVTLTFNEPALAVGTEVVVNDPNARTVSTGAPVLVDNTVTQAVTGELPTGVYTVVYRVTSADGHPIEGQFAFTASGEVAYGVAPSVAPTPTTTTTASSVAPTPTTSPSVAPAPAQRHVSAGPLIGVAAVLVVVGGVAAWLLLRRRSAS